MTTIQDLSTSCTPTWCPGCGNFTIWAAFKNAAVKEGWANTNSVMVAGIGCHGHIVNFLKLTSFEGLHGRALPVASGIKLANHRLNVFVFTGDGDCLGEGGNHFIHACRRNHDLTVFLHDNAVYGLTTGQTSPLSALGYKSKSTPAGNPDFPLNPLTMAIASGATFVARGYSGDIAALTELMIQATKHRGMAVVDIMQPCTTFNKQYTHQFFQDNKYYLEPDYDVMNREKAFQRSLEWGPKKIPLGVFYKIEKPVCESHFPQIATKPLVEIAVQRNNVNELFQKFT